MTDSPIATESHNKEVFDFIDDEGNVLCAACHEPIPCKCAEERRNRLWESEQQRENQILVERLRRDGIADPMYTHLRFEADDLKQAKITDMCRRYVNKWEQMLSTNKGLMFYGPVGTGKTYQSCSIANSLIDKQVPVLVTNLSRILNKIQSTKWGDDRNELFEQLQRYDLVVIDDFGVERSTEYIMEQINLVIDARYRCSKPLIITTNLSLDDLNNATDLVHQRIYDRIQQMCVPVLMDGVSRRTELANQNCDELERMLIL